jgi:hypothetical protein
VLVITTRALWHADIRISDDAISDELLHLRFRARGPLARDSKLVIDFYPAARLEHVSLSACGDRRATSISVFDE